MMDSQTIQMAYLRIVGQCRRYAYILCFIVSIVVGYIGWGYIHQGDESQFNDHGEFQLPPQERMDTKGNSNDNEQNHAQGTLVYDVGYALRGKPWQEVFLGDVEVKQELTARDSVTITDKKHSGNEFHTMLGETSITRGDSDLSVSGGKSTRIINAKDGPSKQNIFTGPRTKEESPIQLVGIIEGPTSYALITKGKTTKSMAPGDSWAGIRLLTVNAGSVQIEAGGQTRWISVGN